MSKLFLVSVTKKLDHLKLTAWGKCVGRAACVGKSGKTCDKRYASGIFMADTDRRAGSGGEQYPVCKGVPCGGRSLRASPVYGRQPRHEPCQ